MLYEAISRLKEPAKTVIKLNLEDYSSPDIAEKLHLSYDNIRKILSRTRNKLRFCILILVPFFNKKSHEQNYNNQNIAITAYSEVKSGYFREDFFKSVKIVKYLLYKSVKTLHFFYRFIFHILLIISYLSTLAR